VSRVNLPSQRLSPTPRGVPPEEAVRHSDRDRRSIFQICLPVAFLLRLTMSMATIRRLIELVGVVAVALDPQSLHGPVGGFDASVCVLAGVNER